MITQHLEGGLYGSQLLPTPYRTGKQREHPSVDEDYGRIASKLLVQLGYVDRIAATVVHVGGGREDEPQSVTILSHGAHGGGDHPDDPFGDAKCPSFGSDHSDCH